MDIAAFLTARFDEDEAGARAAAGRWSPAWSVDPEEWDTGVGVQDKDGRSVAAVHGTYRAEHIARWDPARVLAEVAAKRRQIDWAYEHGEAVDAERGDCHNADAIRAGRCSDRGISAAQDVLQLLAAAYADHPDFDPAWAVDAPH